MRVKDLIKSLDNCQNYTICPDFEVKGISCNSKDIKTDFVFVAIRGTSQDGSKFIDEAIENGAKVIIIQNSLAKRDPARREKFSRKAGKILPQGGKNSKKALFISVRDTRKALGTLASEFYGRPSEKIRVVGITGTNGKTTVSYLIEAILKQKGVPSGVIGTINYRFNNKIIPAKNTTPGPLELQALLCDMLKEGSGYAIMETSSHALTQKRTEAINFHSAIFTNLAEDHLDYHKTIRNYFASKAKLFKDMSPDSFAVINNDDRYGIKLKKVCQAKIVTYGIKNEAQILAKDIKLDYLGTKFLLLSHKIKTNLKTNLIGEYNVYNILAACAWALEEGINISVIKQALEEFTGTPGRLERVGGVRDFSVFVDYAHTEDALRQVIGALRKIARKRIIVVFGCGGDRDRIKRPKMGKVVSELSDYAFITNDNPRSENPLRIIEDIKKGIRKNNYRIIPDRSEAIKESLSLAKAGDIVLIAGKGHENYQIMKDRVIPFADREVIKSCLRSMSY